MRGDELERNVKDEFVYEWRCVGYYTAALKAAVTGVRSVLSDEALLQAMGYESMVVDMEYPNEGQEYPYIHVMYNDKGFKPMSLSRKDYVKNGDSFDEYVRYKFDGTVMVNVYATTILERERICDFLIGASKRICEAIGENDWISIQGNPDTIRSTASNESVGTPWDEDEMTCFRQMSIDVAGEFMYREGANPQYIEKINIIANPNGYPELR